MLDAIPSLSFSPGFGLESVSLPALPGAPTLDGMHCTRFKRAKGGVKRCAHFAGRKRSSSRKHRTHGASLGDLASMLRDVTGVKFHCSRYGVGPSGRIRCGTVSSGGGSPTNRPAGLKKYRKRGRYKKRVRTIQARRHAGHAKRRR